jgi:formylmethanofuran dehydrogenase subunit B
MKLIELVMFMAYMAKVNYIDTLGSVKIWEVYIHNFLMNRNQVVVKNKGYNLQTDFAGGYVKDVIANTSDRDLRFAQKELIEIAKGK